MINCLGEPKIDCKYQGIPALRLKDFASQYLEYLILVLLYFLTIEGSCWVERLTFALLYIWDYLGKVCPEEHVLDRLVLRQTLNIVELVRQLYLVPHKFEQV